MKYTECNLDTVELYTNNIMQICTTADNNKTAEITRDGLNWYEDAKDMCYAISKRFDIPVELVAGVVAVLSPNISWIIQQRHTESFIYEILNGASHTEVGYGYLTNRLKAKKILLEKKVFPHLSGQKVTAFYHNILGDYSTPTIDIWAIRIAISDFSLNRSKAGFYMKDFALRDEIKQAYKVAAKRLKMPVAIAQSLSWTIAIELYREKIIND